MKVKLPSDISDITLGQFQKFDKLTKELEDKTINENEFIKRKIVLFSGIPYKQIENVVQTDLEEVIEQIDKALAIESPFKKRFEMSGVEFGFIDNLDDITVGEYVDLRNYGTDIETMNKLMAVLFRPIKKVDKFGNYKIKKYNGTAELGDVMRNMPLSIVNGALVFFCNLSRELQKHILKSTEAAQEKDKQQVTTLKNGGGTVPSMN